jgi:hypothetical protein
MDRRKFLGTVAGGVLVSPLDVAAEQAGSSGPLKDRLGGSTAVNFAGKVKGVSLTSKPGRPLESAYWIEWDWTGWIRPQIDCAIALGANTARLVGDVAMVASGALSQATYNARLQQVVKYCVDNGLAYYYLGCAPYGTDGANNGTLATPDAQIASVINSNIAAITSGSADFRANIIGADLVSEANAGFSAARVNNIYSLVRPNVPAIIPCTFGTSGALPDSSWLNSISGSCDFIDPHIYPQVYGGINNFPPASAISALHAAFPNKEILFGEGGIDTSQFTSVQVMDWIKNLTSLADMPIARGALLWAAQDQQTSTERYGAFDSNWHPRASIAGPWLKWCRLPYLPVPRSSPDGITIPPAASISDGGGIWTLGASMQHDKQVLLNGASAAGGQATLLSWKNGQIKAQNDLGAWWLWTGNSWIATTPP